MLKPRTGILTILFDNFSYPIHSATFILVNFSSPPASRLIFKILKLSRKPEIYRIKDFLSNVCTIYLNWMFLVVGILDVASKYTSISFKHNRNTSQRENESEALFICSFVMFKFKYYRFIYNNI